MVYFFSIMALMVVLSALGVVLMRNPMYSALCLIVNLVTVAGLFAQLDAHFLSTVQILVYAGAIMVLVLFVLMLLNVKAERLSARDKLLSFAGLVLGLVFIGIAVPPLQRLFTAIPLRVAPIEGTVRNIGELLYTRFVFPFEAASLLIIAGIVGAVMLARRTSRSDPAPGANPGRDQMPKQEAL